MWSLNKSIDYVPVNIFISRVGKSYSHLILKFFSTSITPYFNIFFIY